jgi:ribosome-associated protein
MTNPLTTPSKLSTAFGSETSQFVTSDDESLRLALAVAQAAEERKGADISLLKVTDVCYLTDYFVIVTGFSKVQVRAIARAIQARAADDCQRQPQQVEGVSEGSWIVLDYGDVIVHIFMPNEREFYNLEAFWGHAERIQDSPSNSK